MVRTRRQSVVFRGALLGSALEHPVLWEYVGRDCYLQVAVSKSVAALYATKFEKTTSRNLSKWAAKGRLINLLKWSKELGCVWDEELFLNAIQGGGSADILEYLLGTGCPTPDEVEACNTAARCANLPALRLLHNRGFAWDDDTCVSAAESGSHECLRFAYTSGCPIYPDSVVYMAAFRGFIHILEWIRSEFPSACFDTSTCGQAAGGGHLAALEWLRARGCAWDINTCWNAINGVHPHILKYAVAAGCPWNVHEPIHGDEGATQLLLACEKGNTETILFLLDAKCDVNADTGDNATPLTIAAQSGFTEVVRILLKAGADVNMLERDKTSPILRACVCGNLEIIHMLIDAGADVNIATSVRKYAPLHEACCKGHAAVAGALIHAGARLETLMADGYSPLQLCVNDLEVVKVLVEAGAQVDTPSAAGETALFLAVMNNSPGVIQYLASKGADVDAVNEKGRTPLFFALVKKSAELVKCLISLGADVNLITLGQRPLAWATKFGVTEVVSALMAAGATL